MTASTAELSDFGPIHALLAGDPAALANPSPVYRAIRENAGALALDDVVVLARYDDVRNALTEAKSQGKHDVLMRVKMGDATRFVALPLGNA